LRGHKFTYLLTYLLTRPNVFYGGHINRFSTVTVLAG